MSPASVLPNLHALLAQRMRRPFAWGTADCATLAFDVVQHLTGRDPAPDLRGAYGNALQAARLLVGLGGWAGLAQRFGEPVPVHQAVDGCIVLLEPGACRGSMASGGGLGVLWRGAVLAQGQHGLVALPVRHAARAWRVQPCR